MNNRFENIITLDRVSSSNTYLKENAHDFPTGTALFVDEQTNGRGRFSRVWEGAKGKSIFSSFLIKDIENPTTAIKLTFLFSVAIKKLLAKYISDNRITLKWPNDILIDGRKKICGILSEYNRGNVIIGVGINVFNFKVSEEIKDIFETIENSLLSDKGSRIKMYFDILKKELINEINDNFRLLEQKHNNDFNLITKLWYDEANIHNIKVIITDDTVEAENKKKIIVEGKVVGIDEIGAIMIEAHKTGNIAKYTTGDLSFYDKL